MTTYEQQLFNLKVISDNDHISVSDYRKMNTAVLEGLAYSYDKLKHSDLTKKTVTLKSKVLR